MRQYRSIAGFALIETMVTVVIVAFGLLGIAGLISRAFVTEVEGTQRTQAMPFSSYPWQKKPTCSLIAG